MVSEDKLAASGAGQVQGDKGFRGDEVKVVRENKWKSLTGFYSFNNLIVLFNL